MQHVPPGYPVPASTPVPVWLPKDRSMVKHVVHVYFKQLNHHRPILNRGEFEEVLDGLYDGHPVTHDPGFVCSLYLVLALGTMSELNKLAGNPKEENGHGSSSSKKLPNPGWPEHMELFQRALAVKPDLRVTISSLQALILLHFYLYTEVSDLCLGMLLNILI